MSCPYNGSEFVIAASQKLQGNKLQRVGKIPPLQNTMGLKDYLRAIYETEHLYINQYITYCMTTTYLPVYIFLRIS